MIERTQFDQETLEKQLDLEVITITLNNEGEETRNEFTEFGQCINWPYSRKSFREDNEEGRCMRLLKDLTDIAKEYGVEEEKVFELFEAVSCSKKHLRLALEKKAFTQWTSLDDLMLKAGCDNPDTPEFKELVKSKGLEEIDRRKKFLGFGEYAQ